MKSIHFRLLIAAVAVLLGTAFSQSADDAPPPPMHHHEFGMHHRPMMEFFGDYLNLTDAQRTQMKTILHQDFAAMKPLMQQEHQIHTQMRQYEEGTFDEAKVRALATQEEQSKVELTVQHARVRNQMFQVLTADQQAKFKEAEASRDTRMQKHMHTDTSAAPPAPEQ
jgi:Spy/CpxP family protein refolding chaperone